MLGLISNMNPKKLKDRLDPNHVMTYLKLLAGFMKDQPVDKGFVNSLSSFVAMQTNVNFIDSRQLSSIMWDVLPLINKEELRDEVFYDVVREFEALDQKTDMFRYLGSDNEALTVLPSFTYYRIRRGLFWDKWEDHIKVLHTVANKINKHLHKKYFSAFPYYVAEFYDVLRLVEQGDFNLGIKLGENNLVKKFENSLKLNKIVPAKNCKPLKRCRELLTEEFTDDTVIYYMNVFQTRKDFVYEIPKRILLRRVLSEDIGDYVVKDLCDLCKKWILNPTGESDLLRFEAMIFLLDAEDFADMSIMTPTDIKHLTEKALLFDLDDS